MSFADFLFFEADQQGCQHVRGVPLQEGREQEVAAFFSALQLLEKREAAARVS